MNIDLPHLRDKDQIILPSEEQLDRMLAKVKIALFRKKGAAFLSSLMCNVKFKWTEEFPTAATNGKYIAWNPYFFLYIPFQTRVAVLAHELWHIAYQHMFRLNGRNPMVHNIAGDHVINTKLITDGYTFDGVGFPICEDFKYHEWSVDRVYEDLMNGLIPTPQAGGLAQDLVEGDNYDEAEIIGNIVQAVQASKLAGEVGVVPGDIEEMIDKFLNPILPWEILLQNFFNEMANDDYSYKRPNRRYDDPLLPSLHSDGNLEELNWYIDVSGSISTSMVQRFFSEMVYVKQTYNPGKVNIIQFDTQITKVIELTDDEDFTCIEVYGRGGTSLLPVKSHIDQTKPNAAVIFSDLECIPMDPVSVPVLWAVFCGKDNKNTYAHDPTFGTVIKVRE